MEFNTQNYIDSGILEQYVLGLLTEQEQNEVEQYAKQDPQIQTEISAIETALEGYASLYAQTPPAALKQTIWSQINKTHITEPLAKPNSVEMGQIVALPKQSNAQKWLAAASVALLVSAVLNLFFYNRWQNTQDKLIALNSEKQYFAQQFETQKVLLLQTQTELQYANEPDTKIIHMKGLPNVPDALATIYWNTSTEEVHLKINNLPTPPESKQYQLWAIVDGKPVDAGVFDANGTVQQMKKFKSAQAFAVTLEAIGGSQTPNMDAMFVIGNI